LAKAWLPIDSPDKSHPKERTNDMKKRNGRYVIGFIFLLGIAAFLTDEFSILTAQTSHASKKTEDSMNLAYKTETESPQIPPIDATAPAVFETASFGLG
jgi:hypothetical protein